MNDPLAGYPDMFSINTLARLLGVSYETASRHMHNLPYTNVGFGTQRQNLRVSKEDVRSRFFPHTVKPNLRLVR